MLKNQISSLVGNKKIQNSTNRSLDNSDSNLIEEQTSIFSSAKENEPDEDLISEEKTTEDNDKIYALLANASYEFNKPDAPSEIEGFVRDTSYDTNNKDTGFQGCVFTKDDTVVIAYRGSDPNFKDKKDWKNNLKMLFGKIPPQYEDAIELYRKVKNDSQYSGKKIVLTGHSLGGSLAQLVASTSDENGEKPEVEAITFNAFGRKKFIDKKDDNIKDYGNTTNYYIKGDFVGKRAQPGKSIAFQLKFNKIKRKYIPEYNSAPDFNEKHKVSFKAFHGINYFTNSGDSIWTGVQKEKISYDK